MGGYRLIITSFLDSDLRRLYITVLIKILRRYSLKLSQYIKVKKYASLSTTESREFGITDFTRGWPKRYADNTAQEGVLHRLIDSDDVSQMTKNRIKAFLKATTKQPARKLNLNGKFLYLLKNELGRYKIGVSEDPIYRARVLSNSSGYYCDCVCYWDLKGEPAFKVEAYLHKLFRRNRILGEWFNAELSLGKLYNEMKDYEIITAG